MAGQDTSPFRLEVGLDTNILAYLIDNTFPNLTSFIQLLNDSKIVDFKCSGFARYELLGIRKLEHYLRELLKIANTGGKVNFSSALKLKNKFDASELDYNSVKGSIRDLVGNDLKIISDDFGIEFIGASLNDDFWQPFIELLFETQISKEDALLFLTSADRTAREPWSQIIFLSNDEQFVKELKPGSANPIENLSGFYPYFVYNIREMLHNATKYNLIDRNNNYGTNELESLVKSFVFSHLKIKYSGLYLGEVCRFGCNHDLQNRLLFIQLDPQCTLLPQMYVSIVSKKDLTLYTHTQKIEGWERNNSKLALPFDPSEEDETIIVSTMLLTREGEPLEEDLWSKITTRGSLVFIHPDM